MYSASIIELDFTDSTNNYAMHLIDGNKAQHGTTVLAGVQTGGRGQRGREWVAKAGESILMSIILKPTQLLSQQFTFNASVAVAIVSVLQDLYPNWQVRIKWPNDIIINDKKAGGVLIENVLRGSNWAFSVVGVGINLLQDAFPVSLPHATSLKLASGREFGRLLLAQQLSNAIVAGTAISVTGIWEKYNSLLYKKQEEQMFVRADGSAFLGTVLNANTNGTLDIINEVGQKESIFHGQYTWLYGYKKM